MPIKWTTRRKRLLGGIALILLLPLTAWLIMISLNLAPAFPTFSLSDRLSTMDIEESDSGELKVVFGEAEVRTEFTPEEFVREVKKRKENNEGWDWLFNKLDITGWASVWLVVFGFAAQGVFMSRLIVQWIATEKAKSSVIPPIFWVLSLVGSTMLVIYFIWRKEIVGVVGQSTGWFIYVRNLWYIYGKPRS